jgi:hypothetical protein
MLKAWLLPVPASAQLQQQQQQPERLAESLLPVSADVGALAAALLPGRHGCRQQRAALVAVGDGGRGLTLLLLLLPPQLRLGAPSCSAASSPEEQGDAAEAAAQAGSGGGGGGGGAAQLLPLAATRRASDSTAVRAVQLQLPGSSGLAEDDAAEPAELARLLAEAEVLAAGGDGVLRCLRLSAAAVAAAVAAATGAPQPSAAAGGGSAAGGAAAAAAVPPLLCSFSRRCDAVMQVEGVAGSLAGGSGDGSSSSSGGREGSTVVYGFHSDRFVVWDVGAEAEVARVSPSLAGSAPAAARFCTVVVTKPACCASSRPHCIHSRAQLSCRSAADVLCRPVGPPSRLAQVACGGWRRPSAADVAGADDLALCFVRDDRLWLYRRQPGDAHGTAPHAPPPRCLHPPHHGLEQECLRLVALPAAAAALPALCCITGGDDGLLRQQLLEVPRAGLSAAHAGSDGLHDVADNCGGGSGGGSGGGVGAFAAGAPVGEAPQGTAVKALALLPLPACSGGAGSAGQPRREWLLVAAGAKQSLVAFRLRQPRRQGAAAGASWWLQPLAAEELAVNGPGGGARRRPPNGVRIRRRSFRLSAAVLLNIAASFQATSRHVLQFSNADILWLWGQGVPPQAALVLMLPPPPCRARSWRASSGTSPSAPSSGGTAASPTAAPPPSASLRRRPPPTAAWRCCALVWRSAGGRWAAERAWRSGGAPRRCTTTFPQCCALHTAACTPLRASSKRATAAAAAAGASRATSSAAAAPTVLPQPGTSPPPPQQQQQQACARRQRRALAAGGRRRRRCPRCWRCRGCTSLASTAWPPPLPVSALCCFKEFFEFGQGACQRLQ